MSKTESIAEFIARGGVIKKVQERVQKGVPEATSYANRTYGNTKKADWNKLKDWRLKQLPDGDVACG